MYAISKFKIDKRYYKKLDFVIIIDLIMICLFSLANIFSATHSVSHSHYLFQQALWLVISVIIIYLLLHIDYNIIVNYSTILYWYRWI